MLELGFASPIRVQNGGYFISRGVGRHPRRVIDSYELIVERGCLRLREAGDSFTLGPRDTLLLRPGLLHEGLETFDPELRFYWVHFERSEPPAKALPTW